MTAIQSTLTPPSAGTISMPGTSVSSVYTTWIMGNKYRAMEPYCDEYIYVETENTSSIDVAKSSLHRVHNVSNCSALPQAIPRNLRIQLLNVSAVITSA